MSMSFIYYYEMAAVIVYVLSIIVIDVVSIYIAFNPRIPGGFIRTIVLMAVSISATAGMFRMPSQAWAYWFIISIAVASVWGVWRWCRWFRYYWLPRREKVAADREVMFEAELQAIIEESEAAIMVARAAILAVRRVRERKARTDKYLAEDLAQDKRDKGAS